MLCDELKRFDVVGKYRDEETMQEFRQDGECYDADEVDAAIEELKQKLDKTIAERDGNQVCIDALKQKLEDAKATAYADSVDAGMRERRLRRALWRAIALFCARSCEYFSGIMSHCLMGQDDLYRRCEEKKNKYLNAVYKCRAKAEEYK